MQPPSPFQPPPISDVGHSRTWRQRRTGTEPKPVPTAPDLMFARFPRLPFYQQALVRRPNYEKDGLCAGNEGIVG